MSFKVANTGESIPAKFDGALRSTYAQNSDYIVDNVGDEFALTYNASSLKVTCGTGVANISGRGISSDESNSITLTGNSVVYLCLRIDLDQIQGQEGMLYANTTSAIASDNLSNGSGKHDLLLAVVTTSASGVTSVVDSRVIKGSSLTLKTINGNSLVGSGNVATIEYIDFNNIIAQYSNPDLEDTHQDLTYTATQDCFIYLYVNTNQGKGICKINNGDDLMKESVNNGSGVWQYKELSKFFALKSGDVVSFIINEEVWYVMGYKVYGIRY